MLNTTTTDTIEITHDLLGPTWWQVAGYDYPRAMLHAMTLGAHSTTGDMTETERDSIAKAYGLPWESLGTEIQGEIFKWYFVGVGKREVPAPQKVERGTQQVAEAWG